MAEQKPNEEITQPAGGVSQTPERDAWFAGMKGKYPELGDDEEALFKASREGYDKERKINKQNAEDYGKINDAIARSPEAARFINGLINPEEGAEPEEAFAELGEDLVDLLTGKIDNKAYREKKAAGAKAKADADAASEKLKTDAAAAFEEACGEVGLEVEDAYGKLAAKYGNGGEEVDFRANKDFYVALLKSLTYEDDMLAAEARGRNANVAERKRTAPTNDGLPNSGNAGGAGKAYDPNSLAAIGERRRRMAS